MENSYIDIVEEEKKDKVQDLSNQQPLNIEKQNDVEELKQSIDDKEKSLNNNNIKDDQDQLISAQSNPQVDQPAQNQIDDGSEGDKSGQIPAVYLHPDKDQQVQSQNQEMNSVNDDGDEESKFEEKKVKAKPMNNVEDQSQVTKFKIKNIQEDKQKIPPEENKNEASDENDDDEESQFQRFEKNQEGSKKQKENAQRQQMKKQNKEQQASQQDQNKKQEEQKQKEKEEAKLKREKEEELKIKIEKVQKEEQELIEKGMAKIDAEFVNQKLALDNMVRNIENDEQNAYNKLKKAEEDQQRLEDQIKSINDRHTSLQKKILEFEKINQQFGNDFNMLGEQLLIRPTENPAFNKNYLSLLSAINSKNQENSHKILGSILYLSKVKTIKMMRKNKLDHLYKVIQKLKDLIQTKKLLTQQQFNQQIYQGMHDQVMQVFAQKDVIQLSTSINELKLKQKAFDTAYNKEKIEYDRYVDRRNHLQLDLQVEKQMLIETETQVKQLEQETHQLQISLQQKQSVTPQIIQNAQKAVQDQKIRLAQAQQNFKVMNMKYVLSVEELHQRDREILGLLEKLEKSVLDEKSNQNQILNDTATLLQQQKDQAFRMSQYKNQLQMELIVEEPKIDQQKIDKEQERYKDQKQQDFNSHKFEIIGRTIPNKQIKIKTLNQQFHEQDSKNQALILQKQALYQLILESNKKYEDIKAQFALSQNQFESQNYVDQVKNFAISNLADQDLSQAAKVDHEIHESNLLVEKYVGEKIKAQTAIKEFDMKIANARKQFIVIQKDFSNFKTQIQTKEMLTLKDSIRQDLEAFKRNTIQYRQATISNYLDKFKEKEQNVVKMRNEVLLMKNQNVELENQISQAQLSHQIQKQTNLSQKQLQNDQIKKQFTQQSQKHDQTLSTLENQFKDNEIDIQSLNQQQQELEKQIEKNTLQIELLSVSQNPTQSQLEKTLTELKQKNETLRKQIQSRKSTFEANTRVENESIAQYQEQIQQLKLKIQRIRQEQIERHSSISVQDQAEMNNLFQTTDPSIPNQLQFNPQRQNIDPIHEYIQSEIQNSVSQVQEIDQLQVQANQEKSCITF
eukprot:403339345